MINAIADHEPSVCFAVAGEDRTTVRSNPVCDTIDPQRHVNDARHMGIIDKDRSRVRKRRHGNRRQIWERNDSQRRAAMKRQGSWHAFVRNCSIKAVRIEIAGKRLHRDCMEGALPVKD